MRELLEQLENEKKELEAKRDDMCTYFDGRIDELVRVIAKLEYEIEMSKR